MALKSGNPTFHELLALGDTRARQCTAQSKRSRKRCRNPARRDWTVCRMHGSKPPPGKRLSQNTYQNRGWAMARRIRRREFQTRAISREALTTYTRLFGKDERIRGDAQADLILMLDRVIKGEAGTQAWIETLRGHGLDGIA
jgi:hypothetical protein